MNRKKGTLKTIKGKCNVCNTEFGLDKHGHTRTEYLCLKQPKWQIRIFGETWYYCSDKCLDKDFKYKIKKELIQKKFLWRKAKYRDKKFWYEYKKVPKAKFRLRLTKCYKLLGHNMWDY